MPGGPKHRISAVMEPAESQRPMPLQEVCREHEDEWLLVKVLDPRDRSGEGLCVLLAHGPNRNGIFRARNRIVTQEPRAMLEVLHGATKWGHEASEALRRNIERLKSQGRWISVNPWFG